MRSDETLYAQARAGDTGAFDLLYARYERRLFAFVLRLLGDRGAAEEVFHDTFLELIDGPTLSFDRAPLSAWLFRVAKNRCLNALRSQARGLGAAERLAAFEEATRTPEQHLEQSERASLLAAAVTRLPPPMSTLFHLRTSGLSYDEMAAVLDVPLGTVKSRMSALIHSLRGVLS